jgi:hypothetical protein
MGCCASKKNQTDRTGQNNNNNNNGTRQTKVNPEQTNRNVWEDISPLEAPYPQGKTDLNEILDPHEIQIESIRLPNDEVVPDEKIGKWVTVKN